jgi:hypothetical protein
MGPSYTKVINMFWSGTLEGSSPPNNLYLISEKSSSTNWIFSLFQTEFLLPA